MLRDTQDADYEKRWLNTFTTLAIIMIALILITAIAGLFGNNIYDDFAPAKYVQESRAQDLISLFLGVPLLAIAVFSIRRKLAWGFPLWLGVLAYEFYTYGIYAFGGVYNIFFLGYVAIAGLSIYTFIGLLGRLNTGWFRQSVDEKLPRRWIGGFFVIIVAVFAFIWIGQVMNTISSGVVDSGHLIFVFDLMIVLPAFALAAVKLFQKQPIGDVLAGALLIKFDSLCIAIILGQLFRSLNNIAIETGLLGIFSALGLAGLVFTVIYFKKLHGKPGKSIA